jgi:hypothetical protein
MLVVSMVYRLVEKDVRKVVPHMLPLCCHSHPQLMNLNRATGVAVR